MSAIFVESYIMPNFKISTLFLVAWEGADNIRNLIDGEFDFLVSSSMLLPFILALQYYQFNDNVINSNYFKKYAFNHE